MNKFYVKFITNADEMIEFKEWGTAESILEQYESINETAAAIGIFDENHDDVTDEFLKV